MKSLNHLDVTLLLQPEAAEGQRARFGTGDGRVALAIGLLSSRRRAIRFALEVYPGGNVVHRFIGQSANHDIAERHIHLLPRPLCSRSAKAASMPMTA